MQTLHRLILWLALAGMILAIHLWIQKARDFDQGCLGLDTHALAWETDGGCREVGSLPASHLFGISNAAWGYLFYFALAALTFARGVAGSAWARRFHVIGEAAVAVAFAYSVRLVYEMVFVAESWCLLCLISAGLVTALAVLHVVLRWRGGWQPADEAARTAEFRVSVAALFAGAGLLVAVLVFVDRLGTRPLDRGSTGRTFERMMWESLPLYIDEERLHELRACRFDFSGPVLRPGVFTGPQTEYLGNPRGPEVVVFFDPNCPHCSAYYTEYRRMAARYSDRARFTVVPLLLWRESARQAAALTLAERTGKYFELWQAMFDHSPGHTRSLTVEQIAALFSSLGLDTRELAARLAVAEKEIARLHRLEQRAGLTRAPMLFVAGRLVWGGNRSAECLGTLFDRLDRGVVQPVGSDGR